MCWKISPMGEGVYVSENIPPGGKISANVGKIGKGGREKNVKEKEEQTEEKMEIEVKRVK
jgi:hypothetical protein